MNIKEKYIVNEKGEKTGVVLDMKTYEWMLDIIDTYFCDRAALKAARTAQKEIARGEFTTLNEFMKKYRVKKPEKPKRRTRAA